MSTKVFVSYVDWTIKTPFVSYSDEKFMNEFIKNTKLNNSAIYNNNLTKSGIVNYFIKNRKLGIVNYFIKKNNYYKMKKEITMQNKLLLDEEKDTKENNICSLVAKIFC